MDIACNDCGHSHVCKYKDMYKRIAEQIDNTTLSLDEQKDGSITITRLSDIPFIEAPRIYCNVHLSKVARIRGLVSI